jgi:hypothetical protein
MARSMFGTQQREWWRIHATLVLLQARFLAGRPPGRLLAEARRTAARLDELRSDEAPDAWLLAGRITLASSGPSEGLGPGTLAAALRDARADACHAAAGDPVVTAAGWSFIALGA